MNTQPHSQPNSSESFGQIDVGRYIHLLLHQSWVVILMMVLTGSAGMAYLARTPKIYVSTATIEVESESKKVPTFQQLAVGDFKSNEALKTVEQSLLTSSLTLRVIHQNGLENDPKFAPPRPDGRKYSDSELVNLFQKKLSVSLRKGSRLIDVSVQDESPEQARILTQSIVDLFLSEGLDQKLRNARFASNALQKEADELKSKVERSERNLQEYREKNKAVSLEDKQNIIVDKLKDLNEKATAAKSARLKLESDMAVIRTGTNESPEQLLLLSSIATQPEVENLRRQIQEKESEFSVLKERYLELHPKYIQAEAQLKELNEALHRLVLKAGEQVAHSYKAAKATEEKLMEALAEQEKLSLELHALSIPYNVLAREVESDRALYTAVLNGFKETNVSKGLESNNIRILDAPLASTAPIRPNPLKIMLMAIMAGFGLGISIILAFDTFHGTIRTIEDVEIGLDLPILASVPSEKQAPELLENIVHGLPNSPSAEAFRFLRTNVGLLGRQAEHRVVLFTSAIPDEGKTFCAINYAAALAQQGLRTLLVDADLRRARMSKVLSDTDERDGLSDCLSGIAALKTAAQITRFPNLTLLGAGRRAPNPSELLGSKAFDELISEATQTFDRIVIDTSPVNVVSDALVLTNHAQTICMVIRANSTPRRVVIRALGLIARTGRRPDGIILNRIKLGRNAARHYYYYAGEGSLTPDGRNRA